MDKFFICLANSYKRGGRCVAGIEIAPKTNGKWKMVRNQEGMPQWIRPIANTPYGEIPLHLVNDINILSVIKLVDIQPCPHKAHTEDMLFSHMECCHYDFPNDIELLNRLLDPIHQAIFHSRGRAISTQMMSGLNYSLMLIHPENIQTYIDETREKSKYRMTFTYFGTNYDLPITDPLFLDRMRETPQLYAQIDNAYLTLSLGMEFEGWHHKLVAGVIIPNPAISVDGIHDEVEEKLSYMDKQKLIHPKAYFKWTEEDDLLLTKLYQEGLSIQDLMDRFMRNEGAILSRINKLGLNSCQQPLDTLTSTIESENIPKKSPSNWFDDYEKELIYLTEMKEIIEERIKVLRNNIQQEMKKQGENKIESPHFTIYYTPAKTVMQFDSNSFRQENEELYTAYCKAKQRKETIIIKRTNKE